MQKNHKLGPLHIRQQNHPRTDNVKGSDHHLDIRLWNLRLKLIIGPEGRWALQLGTCDLNEGDEWTISFFTEELYLEHAWTSHQEWAILPLREIVLHGQHICWEVRTGRSRSLMIHTPHRIEMSVPSGRWYSYLNPPPLYAYAIDITSIEAEPTRSIHLN